MVEHAGIELAIYSLQSYRSSQLSYQGIYGRRGQTRTDKAFAPRPKRGPLPFTELHTEVLEIWYTSEIDFLQTLNLVYTNLIH